MSSILRSQLLNSLPAEWPRDSFPEIQRLVESDGRKVVVLDDDPTGTQTVHDVPVLTEWSVGTLTAELSNELPCFYLLTNSRAMPLPEAQALNTLIGQRLAQAAREANRGVVVVSRSDSTFARPLSGRGRCAGGSAGWPIRCDAAHSLVYSWRPPHD